MGKVRSHKHLDESSTFSKTISKTTPRTSTNTLANRIRQGCAAMQQSPATLRETNATLQQTSATPTQPQSPTYNIAVSNTYETLSGGEEENSQLNSAIKKRNKTSLVSTQISRNGRNEAIDPPTQKPPPITIPSMTMNAASSFLAGVVNGRSFQIRLSSQGLKMYAPNVAAYNDAKNKLKDGDFKFYTHLLREEQTSKFVLHGYFKADVGEIVDSLKEIGLSPLKVKNISIRAQRYDDHAVYLVHFLKIDKINISILRENARILNSVRVRWEFFQNRRNGPIQCTNCQQFGHGNSSCFLKPACVRCGQGHLSKECPLLQNSTTIGNRPKIPDSDVRCALCGQGHTSNFTGCEKRLAYMEQQRLLRARIQTRSRQNPTNAPPTMPNRQFMPAHQLNGANFPSIRIENASNGMAWQQQPQQQQNFPNNALFNHNELMAIMREMIVKLRGCTSKEQQIYAVGEVVFKYVYGSN